jgi:hypothetical protein
MTGNYRDVDDKNRPNKGEAMDKLITAIVGLINELSLVAHNLYIITNIAIDEKKEEAKKSRGSGSS